MAQGKIAELPKLGEIKLPVHLMVYDDKENKKRQFHSGFAYWWAADGNSEVTDGDGNVVGMIGGKMGGHVEMSRYYPHNGQPHENGKYKQWVNVIIDVRDIWDQIEELLKSEDVQVQLEGLEELSAKIDKAREEAKIKKEETDKRLAEIKAMQEEAEKEEALGTLISALQNKPEPVVEPEGDLVSVYKIKDTEVYEDNNWDLNEGFNDRDCNFYEKKEAEGIRPNRDKSGKIPINLGCGVRMRDKYGEFLYTDNEKEEGYDREVTLNVTSWIGTSPGAIHYYGNMHFKTCTLHPEGQPTCSTTCWDIPLFGSGDIQLTRVLEAWEFKRYPKTYDGWYAGDSYSGFYTPEEVIARGKEVFKDLFGKGWKLKIDRRY